MGHRRERSMLADALAGALGGLVATWAMRKTEAALERRGSRATLRREAIANDSAGGKATIQAAQRLTRPLGLALADDDAARLAAAIHYVYGGASGAVLGVVSPRLVRRPLVAGAVYGALLWLMIDGVAIPLVGLSPSPRHYPASFHLKALASHAVYGVVADGVARAVRVGAAHP